MIDEQWAALRAGWRRQDTDSAAIYARLRRERWRPHVVLALELLGALLTLVVGGWYAWAAVKQQSLLLALSALVLLLSMPAFALGTLRARRGSLRWEEETPEAMLAVALRRTEASLRAIGVGRWQIAILVVFVAVLWTTQALGYIDALGFLVYYTVITFGAAIPYGVWLGGRQRRLLAEQAACRRMLQELSEAQRADRQSEEGGDPSP